MNPNDPNVQQTQLVARALGPLRDDLVFVGGCAAGLLITDQARPPVRATHDVDLVAEITTQVEYYRLAESLRALGFLEDVGPVICRWRLGDLKLDVMPSAQGVLNFTNIWYAGAIKAAGRIALPNGDHIRLINGPYFLGTKLEAFYDRGGGDYGHHDMEDLINVVDGRPSIIEEIKAQPEDLQVYLRTEVDDLLSDATFVDALPQHFRPNDQERVPIVIARLRQVAGL